jgi:hypothetical protein
LNPGKQEAARSMGLERIAALLRQCSVREALYSHSYDYSTERKNETLPVHVSYREELKILYVKILNFQATCLCHLTKGTASMTIRDIAAWDKWDALVAEIDLQSDNLKSIEEQWRDFKLQERWEIETDQHEENMAKLAPIADEICRIRTVIEKTQLDGSRFDLLKWLSLEDFSKRYNHIRETHESLTGDWLIRNRLYTSWKVTPGSFLWLCGKGMVEHRRKKQFKANYFHSWIWQIVLKVGNPPPTSVENV